MRAEPSGPMGAICFGPPKRDPRPAASKTSVGAVTAPERTALWSGVHRRAPGSRSPEWLLRRQAAETVTYDEVGGPRGHGGVEAIDIGSSHDRPDRSGMTRRGRVLPALRLD